MNETENCLLNEQKSSVSYVGGESRKFWMRFENVVVNGNVRKITIFKNLRRNISWDFLICKQISKDVFSRYRETKINALKEQLESHPQLDAIRIELLVGFSHFPAERKIALTNEERQNIDKIT